MTATTVTTATTLPSATAGWSATAGTHASPRVRDVGAAGVGGAGSAGVVVAASPLTRVVRCAAVASLVVVSAGGSHLLGGGQLPSVPVVAGFLLPVAVVVAVLGKARWTPLRLLAVLAIAQGGFHLALAQMTPGMSPAGMSPVEMGPAGLGAPGVGAPGMPGSGWAMVAWHLVATAVSTLSVLYAERCLWRVLTAVLPRVAAARPVAVDPAAQLPTSTGTGVLGLPRWLCGTLTRIRRGPPAPQAA